MPTPPPVDQRTAPGVLFVPGLWHGAWAWEKVARLLELRGVPVTAITFPGRGRAAGDDTFAGHCAHLRAALDDLDVPPVVVSHSYGGAVVSEVVSTHRATALVFVAAFVLESGESVGGVIDGRYGSEVDADDIELEGDRLVVDRATALGGFYQDCDAAEADAAFARLTPEHPSTRSTRLTRAGWRGLPAHYVVCTEDRAMPPLLQRELAARVQTTGEIRSGHSPMLSRPADLTDQIMGVLDAIRRG